MIELLLYLILTLFILSLVYRLSHEMHVQYIVFMFSLIHLSFLSFLFCSGSASSTTLLYRTLGQSSHLFCKVLMRDPCGGVWSRTVHGPLGFVPERTKTKGEDNDFSLQIASVKSEDAGTFKCDIKCTWLHSISFYELIVVHGEFLEKCADDFNIGLQHVFMGLKS